MLFRPNVYAFAALFILFVRGQGPLPVLVGLEGSFYTPPTISAQINDTIIFEFVGDVHTVTQSTFDSPCTPLIGGFNSGFAGKGTNSSAPTPVWSLVVSNVSEPIWYFCAATQPAFHCSAGMVGVINPPSIDMYSQFVAAAKLVTTTPAINPTPVLTGQGAFATNSPTPSLLSTTSTPSLTTSSTSSTSTTATATASTSTTATTRSSTTSHLGAIVGGVIGGVIALIGLIIVLWLYFLRNKKAPVTPDSDDFFRYNPTPVRRPSEAFFEAKRAESLHRHQTSVTSDTEVNKTIIPTDHLTPARRPTGPVVLSPPELRRRASIQSDLASSSSRPTTTGPTVAERPSNVDLHALAQEVAAVLYQNPPIPSGHHHNDSSKDLRVQQQMTVRNANHDDLDYTDTPQMTQPPPNYRAATGPLLRAKVYKT